MPGSDGSRLARWRGLAAFAARRVVARITSTDRRQTLLAIGGVALSVAMLLVVTSVGLGMLAQSTISSENTDYWIVPEGAASSAVTDVRGQQLGRVHPTTEGIERRDGVKYATPVLMALVRATPADTNATTSDTGVAATTSDRNESTYLVVLGVVPSRQQKSLVGLPTSGLTPGDPYYDNGSYDGRWTGEAVLSTGAADALGVSRTGSSGGSKRGSGGGDRDGSGRESGGGDRDGSGRESGGGDRNVSPDASFAVGRLGENESRYGFSAIAVSDSHATGMGQLPVVIVHLGELQRVTGATSTDGADQILVTASGSSAKSSLEDTVPGADVVTRRGLLLQRASRSRLPIAVAVAASVIAVVVGTLFLGTTLGMEIAAGSRQRAVLSALGFSVGSRVVVLALQVLAVALLGGLTGVVIAGVGVAGTNLVATTFVTDVPVGVFRPLFVVYGLGVALLMGILALPYLVAVSWRSHPTEALVR